MTYILIIFGIPLLLFCLEPFGGGEKRVGLRFCAGVALVWFSLMVYREKVEMPENIRRAAERGDLEYDGVGGNAALLLLGWFPGVIGSAIALLVFLFARWLHRRRREVSQRISAAPPATPTDGEFNPYAVPAAPLGPPDSEDQERSSVERADQGG